MIYTKEVLVVHDFIGNYQNSYMIIVALSDERSYNKDSIRRFVAEGFRAIPGVNIELFVRKNKDDKGSKEFYYLGRMNTIGEPEPFVRVDANLNDVELTYHMDTPIREDLYEYIT